jgi:hypothetical protein
MNRWQRASITFLIALGVVVFLSGCPTEKDAVRTLAGSKGVIEREMGRHGECNPANAAAVPKTTICDALNRAIPAQHAAVLALDAYCSSNDYLTNQGKCLPPTDPNAKKELQAKLTTAIQNLSPLIASVKSAGGAAQ